jgi:hypothetical protein
MVFTKHNVSRTMYVADFIVFKQYYGAGSLEKANKTSRTSATEV